MRLARIVYHLVRYGGESVKRTEAEYDAQVRGRLERQLKRRARELGFEVTKKPEAVSDTPVSVAGDSPVSPPPGE